jgi:hypothetical protein
VDARGPQRGRVAEGQRKGPRCCRLSGRVRRRLRSDPEDQCALVGILRHFCSPRSQQWVTHGSSGRPEWLKREKTTQPMTPTQDMPALRRANPRRRSSTPVGHRCRCSIVCSLGDCRRTEEASRPALDNAYRDRDTVAGGPAHQCGAEGDARGTPANGQMRRPVVHPILWVAASAPTPVRET